MACGSMKKGHKGPPKKGVIPKARKPKKRKV